jgi:arylsulfatase A-like enzyme
MMTSRTAVFEEAGPTGSSSRDLAASPPGFLTLLVLSAWCGLVSGLLEVGVICIRKRTLDHNQLYWTSRHFVWLIPLLDLAIFLVLGLVLSVVVSCRGRRGYWLAVRLLGTLAVLPPIWAASTRIHAVAGLLLALGIAARLVPVVERHAAGFRSLVRISLPVAAGLVPVLALCLWGGDWLKARREEARPLPPSGSPNVLLIVLDTVRADHLSLYGYDRPTTPTLEELAGRGIRLDRVQSTSSWTLPSHASMFTGRWPHELSVGWLTPLNGARPTVAEFLGSRGYATAGIIANEWYCASDSGLARGFTAYRDYVFPRLTAFKSTVLVHRLMEGGQAIERFLENWLDFDLLMPAVDQLGWLLTSQRKEAAVVNREFLDWLSRRRQPERPFFAFLNFYDAHYPYQIPKRAIHRFGAKPRTNRELTMMRDWPALMQDRPSPEQIRFGRDAYDDCIADLDEQLGRLIDELDRRALLERTWVIITADHGESFGEHPGVFWHGTSLYQSQLHVPLVIIPPAGGPAPTPMSTPRVVTAAVSLRDLAATIVDILGLAAGSPFPGESLARFWDGSPRAAVAGQALSEVVPLDTFGPDPTQWIKKTRWPLAALTEGDWTYIRREGNVREELFHVRADAQELHNFADNPAMQPKMSQMRDTLGRLTAGPLTPQRFNP